MDTALFMPWYQSVFVGMYSAINPFLAMDLNNRIALNFLRRHIGKPTKIFCVTRDMKLIDLSMSRPSPR